MTKYCNENCEFITKCNSTLMSWYQCDGQKNSPKVELGDKCVYNEEGDKMNDCKEIDKCWYIAEEFLSGIIEINYSPDNSYSRNAPPINGMWFETKDEAEEYLNNYNKTSNHSDNNEEINQNLFEQFLNEEGNLDIKLKFEEYKNKKSNWLDWFVEHADIPLNEKDACRFAVNEFVKELKKTLHGIAPGELTKPDLDKALKLLGVEV